MNAKIYNGNVQPNPKEFKVWVNDEGLIKTWNGTEWIETASSDSGSGGSGESGGDDSSIEYLDVNGFDITDKNSKYAFLVMYSNSIKAKTMGYVAFCPSGMYDSMAGMSNIDILAVAIDFNLPTNAFGETLKTTKEYILSFPGDFGFTEEELDAIPRLTKEQFYSLE